MSRTSDGSRWDTRRIRRAREFGWFLQNESRLIEEARRRRAAARRGKGPGRFDEADEAALLAHARRMLESLAGRPSAGAG